MNDPSKKPVTLTISWSVLAVLGVIMAFQGLESLIVAYRGANDALAGVAFQDLAKIHPDLPAAIRGRRATAASLAVSLGVLLIWVAATAYRRGESWAWRALLTSVGLGASLSLLRIFLLGQTTGAIQPALFLALLLIALAISYRDFR